MTYLITFACYGCHLHGDTSGSVDYAHNAPGTPILDSDRARVVFEEQRIGQPPYHLDQIRRDAVLEAIQEACVHRGWTLLRPMCTVITDISVVEAEVPPEGAMSDFKAYASRRLNRMRMDRPARNRWPRHGSTRWPWKAQHVSAALEHIVAEQGDAMSVFESQQL